MLLGEKENIIWGAGERAKRAIIEYEIPLDKIVFFIDSSKEKQGGKFWVKDKNREDGKPILPPEILQNIDAKTYVILIAMGDEKYGLTYLEKIGYKDNIYTYSNLGKSIISRRVSSCIEMLDLERKYRKEEGRTEALYADLDNKLIIPRLCAILTTKCSYRCKNCITMTPYYRKQQDLNSEDVIADIENIDELIFLELIGGEPFLYKDLDKIIEYALSVKKYAT